MSTPVLPTPPLSPEQLLGDQKVIEVAKYMKDLGCSASEAMKKAGVEWSSKQFERNMARVAARRWVDAETKQLVQAAARKAAQEGIKRGILGTVGRWLGLQVGTAATVSIGTVAAGVAVGAAVLVVGGYIYVNSGNKPVQEGPAMSGARTPRAGTTGSIPTYNQDAYYVYLMPTISGGSIMVGQESVMKDLPACRIWGGGLCQGNDPPAPREIKLGPFNTYDQATEAWCKALAGAKITTWPLAGDSKATVFGGDYWIGTAPGCPAAR